jgi:transposase-like protein
MEITIKDVLGLAKELPEDKLKEAFERLKELKDQAEREKESAPVKCLNCGSEHVVRNGKRHGRQAYICKECGKSFVQTSTSAIAWSHSSETVWKQVIRDTVEGVALDKTAQDLALSHVTVFNMRHKILYAVEQAVLSAPIKLNGVCEADETYVLESVKGSKIPEDYHRGARKHGAKASKPGLSNEYICVCTSVDDYNNCTAEAVNRATPSKTEIEQIFGEKITENTIILCDGNQNYDVLNDRCTVAHTERVNRVNSFHTMFKERLQAARGVATIYLNRYNALFAQIFAKRDKAVDKIYELMTDRNNTFSTTSAVKSENLLIV